MGTLSYTVTTSLDGLAADADGDFNWLWGVGVPRGLRVWTVVGEGGAAD